MCTADRGLYVGWGYPLSWGQALADDLGARAFFARSFDGRERERPAAVRYLEYLSRTKQEMEACNPNFVIWQIPPSVGPLAFYAAWPRYSRVPWLLDVHSGTVNVRRWRWLLPLLRNGSKKAALAIVHNKEVAAALGEWPCPIVVLDTYVVPPGEDPGTRAHTEDGPIVVTASGMADEPLDAVVFAASQLVPTRRFVITGRREAVVKRLSGLDIPPSVELSGYLSRADYLRLLATASLAVCLTTRPATMQLGAWEAASLECPVIVSDHSVLRSYFGDAASYTGHSGSQLASVVQGVLNNYRTYLTRTQAFAAHMQLRRAEQIHGITEALRP